LIATNTTSIAGLVVASASQQAQITALTGTVGAVQGELFIAEQNIDTLQAKTALLNVVGNYSHFSGYGLKIMNDLIYSVIINRIGDSQWYGLMSLYQGLAVTNGIQSDRVTCATDLVSNGVLQVTGASTLSTTTVNSTLNVTGTSTLYNTNINGTLGVTGTSTLSTTTLPNGNLTISNGSLFVNGASTLNATNLATGNLTITTEILGGVGQLNYINNDTIFNGNMFCNNNLTITNNLNTLNINCDNLNFADSLGGHSMLIGTNGGSISAGNTITIGNAYSVTYLGGIVAFTGAVFNMTNLINQI